MAAIPLIGALLLFCGVVYLAGAAIYRGRMSDPHSNVAGTRTLEPRRRGRFGLRANWPGLLMIVIGGLVLLFPYLS